MLKRDALHKSMISLSRITTVEDYSDAQSAHVLVFNGHIGQIRDPIIVAAPYDPFT